MERRTKIVGGCAIGFAVLLIIIIIVYFVTKKEEGDAGNWSNEQVEAFKASSQQEYFTPSQLVAYNCIVNKIKEKYSFEVARIMNKNGGSFNKVNMEECTSKKKAQSLMKKF